MKALQSTNIEGIINIAHLFNEMGETGIGNELLHRAHHLQYSAEYGFGLDYSAVQSRLNALGASPQLTVDGIWGDKSKAALMAYQRSHPPLAVDGVPGPKSLASLGVSDAANGTSSTMGAITPSSAQADAAAYEVGKRGGAELGLTPQEIQYVLTVAKGEGGYGNGWAHPSARTLELSKQFGLTGYEGMGSNNWGAVQGSGNAGSFPHVDLHADGTPYKANYRKYLTPEDGFKDMAKIILGGGVRKAVGAQEIKDAIAKGNLTAAVNAQHANGYFELNPQSYLTAVLRNYNTIMAGVGWPKILAENGITPVKAGIGAGAVVGLSALAVFLFRRQLGLVPA